MLHRFKELVLHEGVLVTLLAACSCWVLLLLMGLVGGAVGVGGEGLLVGLVYAMKFKAFLPRADLTRRRRKSYWKSFVK